LFLHFGGVFSHNRRRNKSVRRWYALAAPSARLSSAQANTQKSSLFALQSKGKGCRGTRKLRPEIRG